MLPLRLPLLKVVSTKVLMEASYFSDSADFAGEIRVSWEDRVGVAGVFTLLLSTQLQALISIARGKKRTTVFKRTTLKG
jgi:hypothetical protein